MQQLYYLCSLIYQYFVFICSLSIAIVTAVLPIITAFFVLLLTLLLSVVIFLDGCEQPVDLVLLTDLHVLQAINPVHIDTALHVTCQDNWRVRTEPDDSLGCV